MPIYERSYRRWDGELDRRAFRWKPIASTGIQLELRSRKTAFRSLLFYGFLFISQVPFLVFFLLSYIYYYPPEALLPDELLATLDEADPFVVLQYPALMRITHPLLLMYTVLFGSGLIARDRAALALPLYLSRPLTLRDYLLGKFFIIAFFLSCLTMLPCLVLWMFGAFASDELTTEQTWRPLAGILVQGGLLVLVYSLTILAASAVCRRSMVAGIFWFGSVTFLTVIAWAIRGVLDINNVLAVSPFYSTMSVGYWLFDLTRVEAAIGGDEVLFQIGIRQYVDIPVALGAMAFYVLIATWVLVRAVRRHDVTEPSGS